GAPPHAGRPGPTTPHEPPTSGADLTGWTVIDYGTPHEGRMSDASLLGWLLLALFSALVLLPIAASLSVSLISSEPGQWCERRFAELAPEEPTPPRRLRLRSLSGPICGTLPKTRK